MELKKKSFILHVDNLGVINEMSDEQAGLLFKAMLAFHNGEEIELDPLTKMAFSFFKTQFIRDNEKYLKTCEARARAGSKGGKQKVANASKSYQKVAKLADSDSDSDSENVSVSEKVSDKKSSRFAPPSKEQVFECMCEKGYPYKNEAEKFIDFYESNGWKVGKNKMKSWRHAVSNWLRNCKLPKKQVVAHNPQPNHNPIEKLLDL